MKYSYTIDEADLLTFQLYVASKSEIVQKKGKNGRTLLVAVSILFAGYFFTQREYIMGSYFALMAVLLVFFYARYYAWKQKLNYRRFIRANYANRFGMREEMETFPNKIHVKDNFGEGDVLRNELNSVVEIDEYFFINLESGSSIIVPKSQIDAHQMKRDLQSLKTTYNEELAWKWSSKLSKAD